MPDSTANFVGSIIVIIIKPRVRSRATLITLKFDMN